MSNIESVMFVVFLNCVMSTRAMHPSKLQALVIFKRPCCEVVAYSPLFF